MASSQQAQASTNYKEAFSLFDKRGTGRVPRDSLGDLLRACGQNPTLAEIRDLEQGMSGDCSFISIRYNKGKIRNKDVRADSVLTLDDHS